jgi:quercetin dioxygenase-like cupin family protein
MTKVGQLDEQGPHQVAPGVNMYPFWGESIMLNMVELEPNAVVPIHGHPHEQMGMLLSGAVTMTIDGVDYPLEVNGVYQVPGGVPHGATAGPSGCRVLDVFSPVRDDYVALAGG